MANESEAAWGYGMTENGAERGAGVIIEMFTDGSLSTPNLDRILKEDHPSVDEMFRHAETRREVLGLAEYLMKHDLDVSKYKDKILDCIDAELEEEEISTWVEPYKREDALEEFRKKVLAL